MSILNVDTISDAAGTGAPSLPNGFAVSANVTFGNNDKAVFGAANPLEIYHDGSNKYIQDTGGGSLFIRGSDLVLEDAGGNDYITMSDTGTGGTVTLKHSASTKLATSSTGIDVTGTVAATSYTGDGSALTGIVSGREYATAVATTSGTAFDFTGIPAGVNQVTVYFVAVACSGGSGSFVQLGTGAGFTTSGYQSMIFKTPSTNSFATTGFSILSGANAVNGRMTLIRNTASGYIWTNTLAVGTTNGSFSVFGAGQVNIGAELTQLRLKSDTANLGSFSNGTANISWSY